tara:strand:- start:73 stop:798 length:726 start_codon:yes stop_codon:yes gene_type:complete
MKKARKLKLIIGLFYLILIGTFLYFFFSKFGLKEITSFEFVKNNRNYFIELKQSNLFLLAIIYIFFTIIWVLAAGFGSPIAIFGGFVFGKWIGSFIVVIGLSIGASLFYLFANFFLKEMIKDKFLNKFQNLEQKFKKSEFTYLLIYRFIGGIPFAISNILPSMFNVKISNFFWATIIGLLPQIFLVCSIGAGLEKLIDKNIEAPTMIELITSRDIYIPLILFFILVIFTIIIRRFFYKKHQ